MLNELGSDLRYRFRALFDRSAIEDELDAELRFHLERQVAHYERFGLSHSEAMRRARIAFGGIERAKEESRDARGTVLVETARQDLRYAVRGLRARPVFTLGVVLTLGLGIGANAAMFGVIDRLLFRAPPYLKGAERVYVTWISDKSDRTERQIQFARYTDFARWTHAFESIAAFATWRPAVGDGDAARQRPVTAASASYFDLFDARPVLGRFFTALDDSIPRGTPVAVLGYAFWQSEFGGRHDVVGKQLRVGHTLCTIIGVAPEYFIGVSDQGVPALYVPITTFAWDLRGRDYSKAYTWSWLELAVRRRAGISVAAANADLTSAFRRSWIAQAAAMGRPSQLESYRPRASIGPIQLERGPQAGAAGRVMTWVSGVALIVLLIACANVANLLLSRALARRREIALRLALGVGRARLIRQLLTETLVLATLGGAVGLVVAQWGGAALRRAFLPADFPGDVLTDSRTLVVALIAIVFTAGVTGIAPATLALRSALSQTLGPGGRDAGARRSTMRTALLVFQASLSVVLLVGAGLFVRSLRNVRAMRLGYDVSPVLVVSYNMRGVPMTDIERRALEARLVDEAETTVGIVSATPVASVPFWANEGRPLYVPGIDSVSARGQFYLQAGNPEYFRTLGTRILRGRAFDAHNDARSPRVAVVSDGMARALWPGAEPLGKCIRIGADSAPCTIVIGVAEDMHLRSLTAQREHTYYLPIAQYGEATGMLLLRVAGSGESADYAELVRRRLQRLMPGAAYVSTMPFSNVVDPTMQSWRLGATMFAGFGALALTLAGIGLYGVIAYGVAQRRQEIGVRLALGARASDVVGLVVGGALRLVVSGLVLGSAISLWAGRWIATLLFQQSPADPLVYSIVAAVLALVTLLATAVPAISAVRVDPNVALRAE
ncbi:MAG TPA: ABC transporter permease [Gemmatimonadaceae bacterium]|nr:ABC transporter permease [Gemmatimonadaceae bacterium]